MSTEGRNFASLTQMGIETMNKPAEYTPGIYFGMSDETYHRLPYLSATGIKNLLVSPMDFWARSWMNPWKEEDEQETEAKTLGKAYHKRILEGRAAFDAAYAPDFQVFDPDIIKGNDAMQAHLKSLNYSGYSKLKKDGLIAAIREVDPGAQIYDVLKADYEESHRGKIFLDDAMIRKIELSAKMIECHHALKYYFVGGFPEVSVIWDDEEYGVRMKARFDYLKVNAVNDLKTFANMMNKTIERAVYGEMASRKYHIQATLYLRAVEAAKQHVRDGYFHISNQMSQDLSLDQKNFHQWLAAFRDAPPHAFNFVFQQKGPAPVSVGAVFDRLDPMYEIGEACIRQGVDVFQNAVQVFGTDGTPWVDMREPIMLHHMQYPAYANEL